ncbi:PREDICTED: Golgi SNAP receptor complex member 1-like [Chlamydotis macqueenii]|uniref:Golgi SNAP receptor complex member 1-like n=1 Tax=Chlamydotis macqueenii TaxID=187382 RepID=UPI000529C569|nr:PREDICTED: Golgi SNAP receptor complex member 1-like [Chlamydotis macqueenii]
MYPREKATEVTPGRFGCLQKMYPREKATEATPGCFECLQKVKKHSLLKQMANQINIAQIHRLLAWTFISSDRLIEETISIAMATKENMTSQRGMLKSIHSKMNTLANRFPAVNSLIQRINLRKRRDSLILGGVIGICTILLLLYAFH